MLQSIKYKSLILFLIFLFIVPIYSQVREPSPPSEPVFTTNVSKNKTQLPGYSLNGTVIFADNTTNAGVLYLPYDHITFFFSQNKKEYKNTQNITNIKSITFQKWKGYKQNSNTYAFYPIETKIQLKNNISFTCTYFIKDFQKIIFVNLFGETKIYSFFYDYWEKGKWRNSKSKKKDYPEKHPLKPCIKKIVFSEP